jgi:hypothetical protein
MGDQEAAACAPAGQRTAGSVSPLLWPSLLPDRLVWEQWQDEPEKPPHRWRELPTPVLSCDALEGPRAAALKAGLVPGERNDAGE